MHPKTNSLPYVQARRQPAAFRLRTAHYLSIFRWKFINFVAAEYGAVFAYVFGADVAAAAFADTAFHTKLQGGVHLCLVEAQLHQARQYEFNHDGRSADQYGLIGVEADFFQIGRNEAHMAVPALLLPVDGQVYICLLYTSWRPFQSYLSRPRSSWSARKRPYVRW